MSKGKHFLVIIVVAALAMFFTNCTARPDFQGTVTDIESVKQTAVQAREALAPLKDTSTEAKEALKAVDILINKTIPDLENKVTEFKESDEKKQALIDKYRLYYDGVKAAEWIGILLAIIATLLLGAWAALKAYMKFGPASALTQVNGILSKIPFPIPGLKTPTT